MLRATLIAILALTVSASAIAGVIHDAAEQGDSLAITLALASHPNDLNSRDSLNMTPLNWAAHKGHIGIVRELLARGADHQMGDKDSSQPIHNAAAAGHIPALELLIQAGASIDAQDVNGQTPLLFAMLYRHPEAAKWLVEKGAHVNLANSQKSTPLQLAAMAGNIEFARLLIEHGAQTEIPDGMARTPLLLVARESGNGAVAAFLLDHGANINAQDRYGDTPLSLAAWRGFHALTKLLLDRGALLPVDAAARKKMIMQSAGRGSVPLFTALMDSVDVVSERTGTGGTLLHEAAKGGAAELCAMLIDKGLKLEDRDCYGRTALHYAAERGRSQVCSLLISRGAITDALSQAGHTPLSLAAEFGKDTTSALLRTYGAKVAQPEFVKLQGPYFGQDSPGDEPTLFAADVVSSSRFKHGSLTFSPDGLEAFWVSEYAFADSGYSIGGILTSHVEDGYWTVPKLAPFSRVGLGDDVPFFHPDGKRLYFLSRRMEDSVSLGRSHRLWFIEKTSSGWSSPKVIQNDWGGHGLYWQFSIAANGNLYFSSPDRGGLGSGDIWVAKFSGNDWLPPEPLGAPVNSAEMEMSPYIAPDESYLIFSGSNGLRISRRSADGQWMAPVEIVSPSGKRIKGICPNLSADGKYLFLNGPQTGKADIYWISGKVLDRGTM
jgi:ankyrin repeat protein